ncbi:MAG: hypothetical protein ACI4QS_10245 [Comamonas sp.]
MTYTPASSSPRLPTLPTQGGLLGRGFVYRTAEKTDVRLTWAKAMAQIRANKSG